MIEAFHKHCIEQGYEHEFDGVQITYSADHYSQSDVDECNENLDATFPGLVATLVGDYIVIK